MRMGRVCALPLVTALLLHCSSDGEEPGSGPDSGSDSGPDPTGETVGADGGRVVLENNDGDEVAGIEIPRGALSEEVAITISRLEGPSELPVGGSFELLFGSAPAIEIGPTGTTFATPAQVFVNVPMGAWSTDEAMELRLVTIDSGGWVTLEDAEVSINGDIIEVAGSARHLSPFVVARSTEDGGGCEPDCEETTAHLGGFSCDFIGGGDAMGAAVVGHDGAHGVLAGLSVMAEFECSSIVCGACSPTTVTASCVTSADGTCDLDSMTECPASTNSWTVTLTSVSHDSATYVSADDHDLIKAGDGSPYCIGDF